MSTTSTHKTVGNSWAARLLRGAACSLFVHPATIITILIALWLLVHFLSGVHDRTHLAEPWTWGEVLQCGGCLTALSVIVVCAVGHLVLMFVSGMQKSSAEPDRPQE
jgi:hypothetical protein